VERNLAGFEAGMKIVAASEDATDRSEVSRTWPELKAKRASVLGSLGTVFLNLAAQMEAEFPETLHPTLGEAIARLIDYQDGSYAKTFLARVRRLHRLDPGIRLTPIFARRLAVWMTYEDVIRVADLKTRRGRFRRIRQENNVSNGTLVV